MLTIKRAATVAALPLTAASAAVTAATAAPAAAPSASAPAPTTSTTPSGPLVRITGRSLRVTPGQRAQVRLRAGQEPVQVRLRAGRTGATVARATLAADQRRSFRLRTAHGTALWVEAKGETTGRTRSRAIGRVSTLRPALASWYGPGLYGNRTACGQTLTPSLRGVAHKSLPCGTRVEVRYGGRSTQAIVVDRGPFSGAREFDLTNATARAIGFGSSVASG